MAPEDFSTLTHALPDALLLVSRNGAIVRANPAALRLLGTSAPLPAEQFVGEFFNAAPEQWTSFLTLCARSPDATPGGFQLRRHDRTITPCAVSGHRIGHSVDPSTVLILLRVQTQRESVRAFTTLNEKMAQLEKEVVQRRQAQQELQRYHARLEEIVAERTREVQQRTAELEAANKELEAFSYSVSHDLRAPLRSLHGFSAALMEDCEHGINDQCRDYLGRIQAASVKMGRLIDDMLQLSRITRAELQPAPIDLCALARQVTQDLHQRDPARQVEVAIPATCSAHGDPRLLSIALENLIGNAWKFSRDRSAARIEFGRTKKNNEEIYFIRDNGAGFDMAYVDKLFKAFQRLHTEQQFEGTGIGLSIVQRVIFRHGGRIWAEAEEGVGATFYFTLGGDRHDAARTVQ